MGGVQALQLGCDGATAGLAFVLGAFVAIDVLLAGGRLVAVATAIAITVVAVIAFVAALAGAVVAVAATVAVIAAVAFALRNDRQREGKRHPLQAAEPLQRRQGLR